MIDGELYSSHDDTELTSGTVQAVLYDEDEDEVSVRGLTHPLTLTIEVDEPYDTNVSVAGVRVVEEEWCAFLAPTTRVRAQPPPLKHPTHLPPPIAHRLHTPSSLRGSASACAPTTATC